MSSTAPILITGAAQRIGLHCAKRLLAEGFPVIAGYRSERPELAALRDAGATVIQGDLSSEAGILAFIEAVEASTSSLRAVVHNASDWIQESPGNEAAVFDAMYHVHMLAPYLINLRCESLLRQAERADIVHITDDVVRKGSAKHLAYAATKAGLDNLTLSFAAKFAPAIKVNAIAPALIAFHPQDDETYRRKALAKSALGIEPGPEVVYQSLRYLLDNPYLTGTTIPLNGGRHLI